MSSKIGNVWKSEVCVESLRSWSAKSDCERGAPVEISTYEVLRDINILSVAPLRCYLLRMRNLDVFHCNIEKVTETH